VRGVCVPFGGVCDIDARQLYWILECLHANPREQDTIAAQFPGSGAVLQSGCCEAAFGPEQAEWQAPCEEAMRPCAF
jgi:hypothetical protein